MNKYFDIFVGKLYSVWNITGKDFSDENNTRNCDAVRELLNTCRVQSGKYNTGL